MRVLVAGAGGFIGGHLVGRLLKDGCSVRAVDRKPIGSWWQVHGDADNWGQMDLSLRHNCFGACDGVEEAYNLAADMGGIGFIEGHKLECTLSVLASVHLLFAAEKCEVGKFFYASSACVYPGYKQGGPVYLKESDAYPADAEDGYGWEKLFTERVCRHFAEETGLSTRVARFHNVYGPMGEWEGGREKAPAALCRKVAEAKLTKKSTVEIWGDGKQTRSFMHVDDCVEGILRIMGSEYSSPLNLGSSELVSVDDLLSEVEAAAGVQLTRCYDLAAPKGVRGRCSDNTEIKRVLGWEPSIRLRDGVADLYPWVEEQVRRLT